MTHSEPVIHTGKVFLVGAGPGDPGLITVRGMECLQEADIVVFDRLASPRLHRYAAHAEWIDVGKQPDHHPVPQHEINRILIELAKTGKRIVRLKGGDPFVFGRGGEEALALVQAGIPFEVVPGVTSAVAVPAYAGIPVTQRGTASGFCVETGHLSTGLTAESLPHSNRTGLGMTNVFLMGVENMETVVKGLLLDGMSANTPAAVIARGTTPHQRVIIGELSNIVQRAQDISPPAIIVVGEVVRLHSRLDWFGRNAARPLFGLSILNTRPSQSMGQDRLTVALERLGAEVVELPAFRLTEPEDLGDLDQVINNLKFHTDRSAYDWIIFTSGSGVDFFLARLDALGVDVRLLSGIRLGAVGPTTAERLRQARLYPEFMPRRFSGLDWVAEAGDLKNCHILLPRSEAGGPELERAIEEKGARVTSVIAYRPALVNPVPNALEMLRSGNIDIAVYFSPSAIHSTLSFEVTTEEGQEMHSRLVTIPAACIGATTAAAAQAAGMKVVVIPSQSTLEGMVEALVQWQQTREKHS